MRDAWHVNDQKMYSIPYQQTKAEIENLKQVARKGTFNCPYCQALLRVDHGPIKGTYFTHQHGEGCEPSKIATVSQAKYEKQKKRETPRHDLIIALMKDELEVASKINSSLQVKLGYLDTTFRHSFPDLVVAILNRKYALSVLTDINHTTDLTASKIISNRQKEFLEQGYQPIWFIERSQLAVDIDNGSLVFWSTEQAALQVQKEDDRWLQFLHSLATQEEIIRVMNLSKSHLHNPISVKSIIYVTPATEEVALQVYRVIEDLKSNPPKATFLSNAYSMSIAEAFTLENDKLKLSISNIEDKNRLAFKKSYNNNYLQLQQQEEMEKKEQERIANELENTRRQRSYANQETRKVMKNIPNNNSKLNQLMHAYKQNN